MARSMYFIAAIVCLSELVSAEPTFASSLFFPIEHRSDLQEQDKISLDGYDLQIVPNDQFDVAQFDPTTLTITDIIWDFIPNPFTIIKAIGSKVWKIVKFLAPLKLIVLGVALVVGFCAFTPFCTLIIERPFALKLKSLREGIPYIDEAEYFFYEAFDKLRELQNV